MALLKLPSGSFINTENISEIIPGRSIKGAFQTIVRRKGIKKDLVLNMPIDTFKKMYDKYTRVPVTSASEVTP